MNTVEQDIADVLKEAELDLRSRIRSCKWCGDSFIAWNGKMQFCSAECSGEMQKEHKRNWWSRHGRNSPSYLSRLRDEQGVRKCS